MLVDVFFFFNDTATTEIYTLSLHDALPISGSEHRPQGPASVQPARSRAWSVRIGMRRARPRAACVRDPSSKDRKSTRLNSSHANISYAVFCLKKKKHTPALFTAYIEQLSAR